MSRERVPSPSPGPSPRLAYSERERRQTWGEATDRELLFGLQDGEELALDELVRRKMQPLLQVAQRIVGEREEARDVVQMTFLRIWSHRDRYDRTWSPNTWIYRIATNLAIDSLRSRRSRERVAVPLLHHLRQRQSSVSAHRELKASEVDAIFAELALCLTSRQRAIFVLRELEGLPSSEVARILGCRESTVRNHLFNARRILRRELAQRYPEYLPRGGDGASQAEPNGGPT